MLKGKKSRTHELNEDEKCAKHEAKLGGERVPESVENEDELPTLNEEKEVDENHGEKELPLDNILADQRRKYSLKEEYIYLLYNDLIDKFVKTWDGTYIRKTITADDLIDRKTDIEEADKLDELSEQTKEPSDFGESVDNVDWKLTAPDEDAEIIFINGNSYKGRVSRKKMEGQGVYRWHNGSQYTGQFEDNKINGKGHLEWQNGAWYEGDFRNGYRHGKGTMSDKNYNILYIGQWEHGRKHGKGYCRFENGGSYDGDWIMDKREGVGNYIYSDGSQYVGKWKGGLRHGTGTMTWPNGDVYRGEWENGAMHGYGEYTWNGFLNNTLSWPQEVCYMGEWREGTRTGRGQITLNSVGGARYSGEWRNNKKHGSGTIIGNNGEITQGNPLFENDILLPVNPPENHSERNSTKTKNSDEKSVKKINSTSRTSPEKESIARPGTSSKAPLTTVSKPEQYISLDYYINRLRVVKASESSFSLVSQASGLRTASGRCEVCENKSCRCLGRLDGERNDETNIGPSAVHSKGSDSKVTPKIKKSTGVCPLKNEDIPLSVKNSKTPETDTNLKNEKYWTYNCITLHMPRIRKIYDDYAKMFATVTPKCRLSMSRLALWQLWRDCEIHKKSMSLVEIDNYLAGNESTLMVNSSCPFERIEIWQLIHAFLEVSWHFYTKNSEHNATGYPGKLANGLNTFLVNDIYRSVGKCTGILCGPERDLIPLYPVYELYEFIGLSHSARQLLTAIFSVRGTGDSEALPGLLHTEASVPEFLMEGRNSVTVGEKLSFFVSLDSPVIQPKPRLISIEVNDRSNNSLHVFRELGTKILTEIISAVCPLIRDSESGAIINMEYQLTFLEFLEIFVEAGKQLVRQRNMRKNWNSKQFEMDEKISIANSVKDDETKRSNVRLSTGGKLTKTRKRPSSRR